MRADAHPLELRIPPVALTLLAASAAWFGARAFPALRLESAALSWSAAVFALLGLGCSLGGVGSFRRARTTVNPTKPDSATTLVSSGVYRITRNPMYLGFLFVLLGVVAWLGSAVAGLTVPAWVIYLNRFQIAPEERALRARFGAEFVAYAARVPRWL